MKNKYYSLFASMLVLCGVAKAQNNFTATLNGNPMSTTGWNTASVSSVSGNTFVLTQAVTNQAGYIYYNTPTNLTNCAQWTATFDFQITNGSAPPADGLTFFYVTNPPSAFVGGGGIGMPNNPNGLVLILDTYDNNSTPLNNPLVSLRHFDGTGNYVEEGPFGYVTPDLYGQNWILDGNWHTVTLTYNNGVITFAYDGNPASMTVNHPLAITNGYFGFTSGTGALFAKHSIRNVTITGYFPPNAPTVPASTVTYCQGDVAVPLTANGTNLNWYTGPNGGTPSTTAPTPSTAVAGTTTYYVAVQGANSCESPRTPITVVVNAKPNPPGGTLVYNYCIADAPGSFALTGQNIKWFAAATGGTGTATPPTFSTTSITTYTFYASQTVNGCESNRVPVTVNVGSKPAPPTVTTPVLYCTGDVAVPLTAIGQNLNWYFSPTGGVGSNVAPVPYTLAHDTLTYWLTQSNNGCESIRTKLQVYVITRPNGIITSPYAEICQFDTDTFYYFGNADASAMYDWHVPFKYATALGGGGQGPYVARFDSAGVYNVRLQVSNGICVSNEILFPVRVKPAPEVRTTLPDDGCVDKMVTIALNYATPGISGYAWNLDGADVIAGVNDGGPYNVKWSTPGRHVISLIVSAKGCKSSEYKDTIDIHAIPDASIVTPANTQVCSGDTLRLRANFEAEGYSYHWMPEAYFLGNDSSVLNGIILSGKAVSLTVTDTFGCAGTDSMQLDVQPCCEIYLPTAFSPNNDGRNDRFHVLTKGHHSISMFRIQNRWGQTIFETADENRGWDGTMNGTPQDMGVYYYYVRYRCDNGKYFETKGEVTLVR